jgi:hypothetical protein
VAIQQQAFAAARPAEPRAQVLSSAIGAVLPDQRIARLLDELRGIELRAHAMLVKKALKRPLCRRFVPAWRSSDAVGSDQLLQQPFQIALERTDKFSDIVRCAGCCFETDCGALGFG